MTITHCIFDLDGLLLDTETLYTKNTQKILDLYNVEFKYEWKAKMMGTKPTEAAEFLVNETKIDLQPEVFTQQLTELMDIDLTNCKLMPGVYSVLNGLRERNISMCIATGSTKTSFDSKMRNHKDLDQYFSHVVCGGCDPLVKRGKPSPDIFVEAMKRFNVDLKPENVLVFEDSRNGVDAALKAGMKVIWVPDSIEDVDGCRDGVVRLESLNDFDFVILN